MKSIEQLEKEFVRLGKVFKGHTDRANKCAKKYYAVAAEIDRIKFFNIQIGDRVHHYLLGKGIVKWFDFKEKSNGRIKIDFDHGGVKELLTEFSKDKIIKIEADGGE